jgi:hypothetical protein
MADHKDIKVAQRTRDNSNLGNEIAKPTEPVYTVPLEQQTQFEACNTISSTIWPLVLLSVQY